MIKIADKKRSLQLEHDATKINSGDIKVLDNYSDIISRRLIKDTIRDEIPSMHSVTLFLNLQKPQKKIFEQLNRELTKDSSKNVFLIQEFISWVLVHPRVMYINTNMFNYNLYILIRIIIIIKLKLGFI